MKNLYKILIISIMGLLYPFFPVFAQGDDASYMSIDEYSRFFELGFFDDAPQTDEEAEEIEETFTPKLKEKIDLSGEDIITPDETPFKLNVGKTEYLDSYREVFKEQSGKNAYIETEKFSIFSDTTKEQSSYMTNNYKSSMNMKLDLTDKMAIKAGSEIWYVNPDATLGSKKFYVNPSFKIGKGLSLNYTGRYNQTTKNIEQEVGLNYSPKLFKDNAKFGVSASTVINDNNEIQSKKIKFSTDLYIF